MSQTTRFLLPQADRPKQWYNLLADFPEPLPPPLHPGTREPVSPEMMAREAGKKRVILFNLSGHGLLDLSSYETYLEGKIQEV